MDSAQSRPLHRWTFRDRPNGNSEDAEARKTVDTFQWAHSELTGSLMHGHENRARYAKAEDEEMRLVDVEKHRNFDFDFNFDINN
ncbi:hypothetical protein H113_08692 [Trichophyton rubrum MR1459]|uniref:Uncharacterized protein n=2 Tax=Trichophyton TaxID=5550 RepID=A0A022VP32_TRIRU|nr:hypothetical protein H102_08601 [Trichophyton rubrum CBS 100081]EZF47523.1 hypothetical protein H103_08624 [Trichophyton rubrum CBS 288.86]EZF58181.1 hypothetical protein H104_08576 [Trichophyton rubrum CBS 289.86]EZF68846.1 hypothetical protein H105_08628 [Trichophyton soudanense CBS 452.61]EZF79523.1 hypothetical protein H110_08626 [Trichophyton rubrum MR1448]EZF90050.1 hypothetical protein H113_08692 [Trichophyton rubrum MR1459]